MTSRYTLKAEHSCTRTLVKRKFLAWSSFLFALKFALISPSPPPVDTSQLRQEFPGRHVLRKDRKCDEKETTFLWNSLGTFCVRLLFSASELNWTLFAMGLFGKTPPRDPKLQCQVKKTLLFYYWDTNSVFFSLPGLVPADQEGGLRLGQTGMEIRRHPPTIRSHIRSC